MLVDDISDTARWIAHYRAEESERRDALFRDPYARRLAGEPTGDVARLISRGRGMDWAMAVRTAVIDELILRVVTEQQIDTVLMLGAGLDTRPYRLPLPASLSWHEVDLPALVAWKEEALQGEAAVCTIIREGLDLADQTGQSALFEQVARTATKALVVSEGLLVYLPPPRVAGLASSLAAHRPFRWWIMDIVSPPLLRMMLGAAGESMPRNKDPAYFGPREGAAFFRPFGWRVAEYRSSLADAVRLRRASPMVAAMDWASRMLPGGGALSRLGGNVLLERVVDDAPM